METITQTINGRKYELLSFGSLKSLRLASKIASTLKGSNINQDSGMEDLIFHLVGDENFSDLVEQLCEGLTCEGLAINFDNHFAKHKTDLLPCIGMSLKENIVPFFSPEALEQVLGTLADL